MNISNGNTDFSNRSSLRKDLATTDQEDWSTLDENKRIMMSDGVLIISSKFEGHKAPVLSLDFAGGENGNSSPLLLSGSEDRTARLWDVRDDSSKRRACLCIPVQGEVLSVKFAPRRPPSVDDDDDDQMMAIEDSSASPMNPFAKDHTMYV